MASTAKSETSMITTKLDDVSEFDQNSDATRVLLYRFSKNPYLQQIKMRLSARDTIRVREATFAQDIISEIETSSSGLVLLSVQNIPDLKQVSKTLRKLKYLIDSSEVRIFALSDLDDPRVIKLLKGRGCVDVVPTGLIWNQLEAKIDFEIGQLAPVRARTSLDLEPDHSESSDPMLFGQNPSPGQKLKVWLGSSDPENTALTEVKVIEFSEDSMTLEVGANQFQAGQEVVMIVDDGNRQPTSKIKVIANLLDVTPIENQQDLIFLSMPSPEKIQPFVENVLKKQVELQAKIFDFLKAARGY
jgi:hypothetical protein